MRYLLPPDYHPVVDLEGTVKLKYYRRKETFSGVPDPHLRGNPNRGPDGKYIGRNGANGHGRVNENGRYLDHIFFDPERIAARPHPKPSKLLDGLLFYALI